MSEPTALLPCPFCGKPPVLNSRLGAGGAVCRNGHLVQTYGMNEATAIAAWNTRQPADTAAVERVAIAMYTAAAKGVPPGDDWELYAPDYRELAIAAIAAMSPETL